MFLIFSHFLLLLFCALHLVRNKCQCDKMFSVLCFSNWLKLFNFPRKNLHIWFGPCTYCFMKNIRTMINWTCFCKQCRNLHYNNFLFWFVSPVFFRFYLCFFSVKDFEISTNRIPSHVCNTFCALCVCLCVVIFKYVLYNVFLLLQIL